MDETSYAVRMLNFATNLREPLDWTFVSQNADTSNIFADAERVAIKVSASISPNIDRLLRFSETIRSSHTISSVRLYGMDYTEIIKEPRIIPVLAEALRSAKSLRKLTLDADLSSNLLNLLVKLLGPESDIQVSLRLCRGENKLTTQHIEILRRIHSLCRLRVHRIRIDAAAFSDSLRDDWPGLCSLTLTDSELDAEGAKAIGGVLEKVAPGLQTLDLSQDHLDDSGITAIVEGLLRAYSRTEEKRGALRKLSLPDNCINSDGWIQVAKLVKSNPHLTRIDMSHNNIGSAGTAFGDSLQSCAATLKKLLLTVCRLDERAVIAVSRSLAGSCSLSILDIACSRLKNSAEAMRTFAQELIAGSKSLEDLDISRNYLDEPGIKELVEGLMKNNSLKKVDLSYNNGVGAEITPMIEAILHLKLQELNLRSCSIDDEGGKALGKFVALSSSLRHLDVSYNKLHTDGAKAISVGVAQSCSLERLRIESNELGDEGARCVAEWVIRRSKTLQVLDISTSGKGAEGAKAVAKAIMDVAGNTTLKEIYLDEDGELGVQVLNVMESIPNLQNSHIGLLF